MHALLRLPLPQLLWYSALTFHAAKCLELQGNGFQSHDFGDQIIHGGEGMSFPLLLLAAAMYFQNFQGMMTKDHN